MSSGSSVSIKSLSFPEEYSTFNVKTPKCSKPVIVRKPSIVKSSDMGEAHIFSVLKPKVESSPLDKTPSSVTFTKSSSRKSSRPSTSKAMGDTFHNKSQIAKRIEFKAPCPDSVVLGRPKPFIGHCPANDIAAEQISSKKKITLTEDPRKRFCLRNPQVMHFKPMPLLQELGNIRELVKTAENLVTSSGSQSSVSSICEIIDLANPVNLDFQGMDYKNTYVQDEQSTQNKMEYRKLRRYKQRRNVKEATIVNTEKEQQSERISIPQHFQVDNPPPVPPRKFPKPKELLSFGKLVRAELKPKIKRQLEEEEKDRVGRYKQLYLDKKAKLAQKAEDEREKQRIEMENNAKMLAEKDIQDLVGLLDRTITTKKMPPRKIPKRRDFPHTLDDTLRFRHQLKKSKRVLRDKARVKEEFYSQIAKPKVFAEANLEISSESRSPSPRSEMQSTNDEDDMVVGQRGSKFLLRGFLYKLGTNLRGKFHQREKEGEHKVRGCMTREEWFETLVSKRKKIELIDKPAPGMELFPRALGVHQIFAKSPIKEFRLKPLGRHYDRVIRRNLRIKKTKQIKVKKFNLISFLYGIGAKKKDAVSVSSVHEIPQQGQTLEYMRNRAKMERVKKRIQKRRRMHYLGIPCPQKQGKKAKSLCVDSESTDSDWIPDDKSANEGETEHPTFRERGNMPAPEFRETTLCRHPRHPRDYKSLRVPSGMIEDFIQQTHHPIMRKLKEDRYVRQNVRAIKETDYGHKFEARHHHPHWDPTQHKYVDVQYKRKIVRPKPMEGESKKVAAQLPKTFDKARPRGDIEGLEDINFASPKLDIDAIIREFNSRTGGGDKSKTRLQQKPLPTMRDMIFHSLAEGELQEFPGRDKFLEFLYEIKAELDKRAGITEVTELAIDKNAYLKELQDDLKSIESCLTSLSSSDCTNLTQDSGSFLLAGDTKIPLDYIRKSLVPFEELNRSRFSAVPIDPAKEEQDPFRMVPFAGQQKEQISMAAPKDSFFTFNTRIQNGLRLRLEVRQEDPRKQLLGPRGGVKAPPKVATDIDELYIEDLRKRPGFKPFKWNSCRTIIKDALRKKFESMLIQGEIVRTKIYDRRNEYYFDQMMQSKLLFEKLFAKWEKKEYEAAMEVVHKVKPYYEATDKYRRESYELGKQYTVLNMEIVYIENDWMRRTILQNFHYLLAEMEWRAANDWIHRNADGNLEGFEESIAKRSTTNIRQRDKDDAWAIKEYYENVYLQNYHPIIVVFQNAKEFIAGIENLKAKTFVLLLELHYTLWILAELDQKYQEFSDWCTVELESKKTYAENKCANKYYMEDRASQLKAQVQVYLGRPIDQTFSDKRVSQMKGICNEVYKDVVPPASQMDVSSMEQVAMISQVLTDLIAKFEVIPVDHRRKVEKRYRKMLAYHRNLSRQAVIVERRINSEMDKVRRNLAPPYKKPKREGKLPRSELPKTVRVVAPKPVIISEKTKFFYRAFHDEGDLTTLKEARESLDVMDGIQESIVPFYFDYFLSINGYQPNYNFKTQVELRDGPEIERFQVKTVVPEVLEKFEKWQQMKKRTMDENINRNQKMYHDVQI